MDLTTIDANQLPVITEEQGAHHRILRPRQKRAASPCSEDSDKSPFDLNSIENWRNLALKTSSKNREAKYTRKHPEMSVVLKAGKLQPPKNTLLLNGNYSGYINIDKNLKVEVVNTCPFDAVVQILGQCFTDFENLHELFNDTENLTLQTAKSLSVAGAVEVTERLRCLAIKKAYPSEARRLKFKEKGKVLHESYDLYKNLSKVVKELFKDMPNLQKTYLCHNRCRTIPTTCDILEVDYNLLCFEGLKKLGEAIRAKSVQLFMGTQEYSLVGVIAQLPAHYIAYKRRITNCWDECNNVASDKKVKTNIQKTTLVYPVMVIYAELST